MDTMRDDDGVMGQVFGDNYKELVESIRRNLDPSSNTVLIVDDEKGIRLKVARDVLAFDPRLVIVEACNGQEGL